MEINAYIIWDPETLSLYLLFLNFLLFSDFNLN